jgi:hypothetical protein
MENKKPTAEQIKACREDTEEHIYKVARYLFKMIDLLRGRAAGHDASKLEEPELSMFAYYGPKLKEMTFGSDEYKAALAEMKEQALDHHYARNSHHPEHTDRGIEGMNLIDVLEMLCDWKAATLRMKDGDLNKSIDYNVSRFGIDPQLEAILRNTVELFED